MAVKTVGNPLRLRGSGKLQAERIRLSLRRPVIVLGMKAGTGPKSKKQQQ
ncbi:MAG TPA: hypothetical protein VN616_15995 [Puia sp.]|nr:hypothetical protein [Puia sp.]